MREFSEILTNYGVKFRTEQDGKTFIYEFSEQRDVDAFKTMVKKLYAPSKTVTESLSGLMNISLRYTGLIIKQRMNFAFNISNEKPFEYMTPVFTKWHEEKLSSKAVSAIAAPFSAAAASVPAATEAKRVPVAPSAPIRANLREDAPAAAAWSPMVAEAPRAANLRTAALAAASSPMVAEAPRATDFAAAAVEAFSQSLAKFNVTFRTEENDNIFVYEFPSQRDAVKFRQVVQEIYDDSWDDDKLNALIVQSLKDPVAGATIRQNVAKLKGLVFDGVAQTPMTIMSLVFEKCHKNSKAVAKVKLPRATDLRGETPAVSASVVAASEPPRVADLRNDTLVAVSAPVAEVSELPLAIDLHAEALAAISGPVAEVSELAPAPDLLDGASDAKQALLARVALIQSIINPLIDNICDKKNGRATWFTWNTETKSQKLKAISQWLEHAEALEPAQEGVVLAVIQHVCSIKRNALGLFAPHSLNEFNDLLRAKGLQASEVNLTYEQSLKLDDANELDALMTSLFNASCGQNLSA